MNLKEVYDKVSTLIAGIDFSCLWKNFNPIKFALYNQTECFFDGKYIEKTDQFIGNTAIHYHDEIIAIWFLEDQIDVNILTSKIIHEMFHGFQMLNNESRYANEFEALYQYQYLDENLTIKLEENKILNQLHQHFNIELFQTFLRLRKYRLARYPYEFGYESKIEQIEGTANFVEMQALKQLSLDAFHAKQDKMMQKIVSPTSLLPIRIVSYDIGALLLFIMKENRVFYTEDFSSITIFESLLNGIVETDGKLECSMGPFIKRYYEEALQTINTALASGAVIVDKEVNILGLNVYNAIYYRNYLISRSFIMIGEMPNPNVYYGDFVIETQQQAVASKIYKI